MWRLSFLLFAGFESERLIMFLTPPPLSFFPEAPAGTSAPKLPSKEKHFTDVKEAGADLALFCSVQASPVPSHR